MGLDVAMLVRVIRYIKEVKGDETEVNEHMFAYLPFHRMPLVRARIADELLGCRVSE